MTFRSKTPQRALTSGHRPNNLASVLQQIGHRDPLRSMQYRTPPDHRIAVRSIYRKPTPSAIGVKRSNVVEEAPRPLKRWGATHPNVMPAGLTGPPRVETRRGRAHLARRDAPPPRLGSDFCTVIERMITTPTAVPDNSRGSNHRPEQLFNEVTPTIDGIPSAGDAPDRSFSVVWSFFSTPFRLSPARRPRISPEPADSPHCHSTAVHFSRGAQIFNRPRQPRAKTASQQPAVSFPAHPVV